MLRRTQQIAMTADTIKRIAKIWAAKKIPPSTYSLLFRYIARITPAAIGATKRYQYLEKSCSGKKNVVISKSRSQSTGHSFGHTFSPAVLFREYLTQCRAST